jgi:eukaryotic-like serine/threonine-protein kinase
MSAFSIGKFTVIGTLGTGAHSTIMHIRRNADSTHYALKVIPLDNADDQKYHDQAQQEFTVGQKLDHASLIKVYALEAVKDWLFRVRKVHLLIEYVNGQTLDTCPPMRLPQLVQVFERVAAGMMHMHRRQICHADLKPNNIMLSRAGAVKVIDFGLAHLRGEKNDRLQGTPEYIAPEQAKHKMVNERTDIYNFGATMYRLLTFRFPPCAVSDPGEPPLDARTWKHLFKPVQEFNAEAPPALCNLVHQCLAFNAAERPESAGEIKGILRHLVDKLAPAPEDRLENREW